LQTIQPLDGKLGKRALSLALNVAALAVSVTLCEQAISSPLKTSNNKRSCLQNVIVSFKAQPTPAQIAHLKALGFDLTRHLTIINAVGGSIREDRLKEAAGVDGVSQVTDDQGVKKTDAFTVNSSLAGAAYTKYGSLGTGIGVAVLDSGVIGVDDFKSLPGTPSGNRLKASVDFSGKGANDQCGHGTHVAGIIAGDGAQSYGAKYSQTFYGVAPGASLINVRVLDQQGSGSVANVIAGVQWAVANRAKYNIRVINMSLGHPVTQSYSTDPLCQAVEAAWKSGIVVVCAAGNGGRANTYVTAGKDNEGYGTAYGTVEVPGNDPYVITVGATKQVDNNRADDEIATYSSRGPTAGDLVLKPDIIAPGNHVISTEDHSNNYLLKTYGTQVQINNSLYQTKASGYSDKYYMLSGTSMAAPVVSGAVAMMLQQQPNLTPDTVKARLMVSADKWLQPNGDADACTFGAGYLNVQAAMGSTVVATTAAMSPSVVQPSNGLWFVDLDPTIYGERAMWGTGITNLQTIYGSRAMWGTGFVVLNASRAMWGTGFYNLSASSLGKNGNIDCTSNSVLVKGE